jgi:hypothetical protein
VTAAASHSRVVALVPAWTAADFIGETLDALAAQSCPNLEILVSDDASPDDTVAICERYAARDARFRVIRQPRNLGWTENVNALLREARGDYFLIAGHDDLLAPGYVERCVAGLEAEPRAVVAFSDVVLVKADGRRELKSYALLDGISDRALRARRIARRKGAHWIPYRGVFRAPAARVIGGLRRHLGGEFSADWPWLLHLSLLGGFVRIPEPLYTKITARGACRGIGTATRVLERGHALRHGGGSRAELPGARSWALREPARVLAVAPAAGGLGNAWVGSGRYARRPPAAARQRRREPLSTHGSELVKPKSAASALDVGGDDTEVSSPIRKAKVAERLSPGSARAAAPGRRSRSDCRPSRSCRRPRVASHPAARRRRARTAVPFSTTSTRAVRTAFATSPRSTRSGAKLRGRSTSRTGSLPRSAAPRCGGWRGGGRRSARCRAARTRRAVGGGADRRRERGTSDANG